MVNHHLHIKCIIRLCIIKVFGVHHSKYIQYVHSILGGHICPCISIGGSCAKLG